MKDGIYIFEYDYRKQIWLVQNCMRKVLKDLSSGWQPQCSGIIMDLQPHSIFVPINEYLYKYLRLLTEEEKLELL